MPGWSSIMVYVTHPLFIWRQGLNLAILLPLPLKQLGFCHRAQIFLFVIFCFETGSLFVALAGLEFAV